MTRVPCLLILTLAAVWTAGCDSASSPPESFSLEVTVETASGAPAAGRAVRLRYTPVVTPAAATSARGGFSEFDAAYPSPWRGGARLPVHLVRPIAAPRLDWYDATGQLVTSDSLPIPNAGTFQVPISTQTRDGSLLPGGLYRIVGRFGRDEPELWTAVSDAAPSGASWTRTLGTTDAAGTIRTTDAAVAPAVFAPTAVVIHTTAARDTLGTFTPPASAIVEVLDAAGGVAGTATVTLADGANRVTVQL